MIHRTINITGNARNVRGRAMLEAENIGTYRVAGITRWEAAWVDQRVKIIGDLEFHKKKKYNLIRRPVVQLLR